MLATFRETAAQHGIPASTLTDNGLVFTTRFAGGRGSTQRPRAPNSRRLDIVQKNSRPNHPTTCGKVETIPADHEEVAARPTHPANHRSPSSRPCSTPSPTSTTTAGRTAPCHTRATPATAYRARPKATPAADRTADAHHRVRTDRVDHSGCVTLRVNGRLHHIGIGRTHARTHIVLLIQDLEIRVVDAATGELLRELTLDPNKDYQGTGRPPAATTRSTQK